MPKTVSSSRELKNHDETSLKKSFVKLSKLHRAYFVSGEIRKSNDIMDKILALGVYIHRLQDSGLSIYRELVSSKYEEVRSHAASFLLGLDSQLAEATLENLAEHANSASISLTAETTLEEWRAGRFDPNWFLHRHLS
jgi:hypothetical protein